MNEDEIDMNVKVNFNSPLFVLNSYPFEVFNGVWNTVLTQQTKIEDET